MDDVKTILERDFNLEKVNSKNELDEFTLMLFDEEENKSAEDVMGDVKLSSLLKRYLELFGLSASDDYSEFVPRDFDLASNTEFKCRILQEAIDNRIRIDETSLYPSLVEHVEFNDENNSIIK